MKTSTGVIKDPRGEAFDKAQTSQLAANDPSLTAQIFLNHRLNNPLVQYQEVIHAWTGSHYKPVSKSNLRSDLWKFLIQKDIFKPKAKDISDVADALAGLVYIPEAYQPPFWLGSGNTAPGIISFQNGFLHIDDSGQCEFKPHDSNLFITAACDYEFDTNAPEPVLWFDFLEQLWGADSASIAALQEWFGLMLTADTRLQTMLMLVGPKRSGKGTIARVLRGVVGPTNTAGPTLSSLAQPFGLAGMIGKRLAIISDARLSRHIDEQIIAERLLSVTGEDAINVPRKFLADWTGQLGARIIFLSNELPRISDTSGALASRLLLLILRKTFYHREDRTLTDKLLAERSGIATWALEGLRRLRNRGHFIQPDSARDAIETFSEIGSPVSSFVDEECLVEPGAQVSVNNLWAAWCNWCAEQGRKQHSSKQLFGRDIRAVVPGLTVTKPREGGRQFRYYCGIGLLADVSDYRASCASESQRGAMRRDSEDCTDNRTRGNLTDNNINDNRVNRASCASSSVIDAIKDAVKGLGITPDEFLKRLDQNDMVDIETGKTSADELRKWAETFDQEKRK